MSENGSHIRKLLGQNIKKFRGRKAWSQAQLAERLNLSTNFLADIETGKKWLSSTTLENLCRVLDISAYELFLPQSANSDNASDALPTTQETTADNIQRVIDDLSIVLTDSVDQAILRSIEHIKNQYIK